MLPEDIDDLFRDGLDGHPTPPDPALWARLAAAAPPGTPAADDTRLDELFHTRLAGHATPPGRVLWERLEDEHLRPPRKRRGAAWWPPALAAVVALLVVAGGAGLLWRPGSGRRPGSELAARAPAAGPRAATGPLSPAKTNAPAAAARTVAVGGATAARAPAPVPQAALAAAGPGGPSAAQAAKTTSLAAAKNIFSRRATRFAALASSGSSATKRAAVSTSVSAQPRPARFAAPEDPLAPAPRGPRPLDTGALAVVPAVGAEPAGAASVIEVEIRPGSAAPVAAVATAETLADDDRPAGRRVLGSLLRQARHLVRGERVSLAEATGLPENFTLQASLGGRTLVRTIQL